MLNTLAGKHRMEKEAASFDVTFRADNGIFRAQEFMIDIEKKNQSISFCAVNEHSQNGIAERNIRTIVERARTSLLHASTKWPTVISTELWTFAVNYAVHQWNHTPLEDLTWFTPEEVFTGVQDEHASYKNNAMSSFHPFGCPVYVLQTELQKGESIPKWDPRVRTGIFLGHSRQHARNVNLILNPHTDIISCQYHCYFDDNFHTIPPDTKSDKIAVWKGIEKAQQHIHKEPISFALSSYENDNMKILHDSFTDNFTHFMKDKTTKDQKRNRTSKKPHPRSKRKVSFSSLRHPPPLPPPPSDMSSSEGEQPHKDDIDEIDLATLQPSTCKLKPIRSNRRHHRNIVVPTDSRKRKGQGSRVSKRKRKPSSKVLETLKQVQDLAANLTELESKHSRPMTFAEKVDHLMHLTSLPNGECNDLNPHALAASVNPNILSHRDAMKAEDSHLFTNAMEEEIYKNDRK